MIQTQHSFPSSAVPKIDTKAIQIEREDLTPTEAPAAPVTVDKVDVVKKPALKEMKNDKSE